MQQTERTRCLNQRPNSRRRSRVVSLTAILASAVVLALALSPSAQAQDNSTPAAPSAASAPAASPAASAPAAAPAAPAANTPTVGAPSSAPAAAPEAASASIGGAQLADDLSPWGMFLNADIVVKIVMIGLLIASVVTWTVWLAKTFELRSARSEVRRDLRILNKSATIAQAHEQLRDGNSAVALLMQSAAQEIRLSANLRARGLEGAHRAAARAHRNGHQPEDFARHRHPRHHRLDRALRRPVRHGVGHHEQLYRHFERPHDEPRRGGARHRAGAACHRLRSRRRNPGGRDLQRAGAPDPALPRLSSATPRRR